MEFSATMKMAVGSTIFRRRTNHQVTDGLALQKRMYIIVWREETEQISSKIQESYFGWNLLYLSKKHPRPNFKFNQILNLDLSEKIGKIVIT